MLGGAPRARSIDRQTEYTTRSSVVGRAIPGIASQSAHPSRPRTGTPPVAFAPVSAYAWAAARDWWSRRPASARRSASTPRRRNDSREGGVPESYRRPNGGGARANGCARRRAGGGSWWCDKLTTRASERMAPDKGGGDGDAATDSLLFPLPANAPWARCCVAASRGI